MKLGAVVIVILLLASGRLLAQLPSSVSAKPQISAGSLDTDTHLAPLVIPDAPLAQSDTLSTKHLVIQGPLVRPFKAKSVLDAPRRLLHSINPFARRDHVEQIENPRDLSPHAWTTFVGWHPGASAFADPVTHESGMSLISVSGR